MKSETDRLRQDFRRAYRGEAWYGECAVKVLDAIPAEVAFVKSGTAHSIAELVSHMIAWRIYVLKRLAGDDTFELQPEETFRWEKFGGSSPDQSWEKLRRALDENQDDLESQIVQISEDQLDRQVAGIPYTCRELIDGIIQHDVYHLGQIVMLRKHFSGKE